MNRTPATWILGATGRIGSAVVQRLAAEDDRAPVLVGRSVDGLNRVAGALPGSVRTLVIPTHEALLERLRRDRPAIVVNAMGRYAQTAVEIARACMPGGLYVDVANDLISIPALVALNQEAADSGSTLITGAGFGVVATESIVFSLCSNATVPIHVQVDALASVATEAGSIGEAFAATTMDVITTGGRKYRDGRIVRTRLGSDPQRLTLPDGTTVVSAAVPSGELHAARAASGAPSIVVTSALAPTGYVVRAALPALGKLLSIESVRRFAVRQFASTRIKAAPRPRPHSWGHAVVEWADGARKEGWLRADDGMMYTVGVIDAVIRRLLSGSAPVGAFTPAAA